ncbi:hypothetical protein KAW65_06210 [candidate division WOR-3 bacterium]|nr:hypothetical protein [candidate division WOR-3 bacterium]
MKKFVLILGFIILGCGGINWVEKLEKDNYSMVELGKYPYTTRQIKEDKKIDKIKDKIDKQRELMSKFVCHFYPESYKTLNFKYRFASLHQDKLILRYFAIAQDEVFAGYSVQFVIQGETVKKIYLSKVPLDRK